RVGAPAIPAPASPPLPAPSLSPSRGHYRTGANAARPGCSLAASGVAPSEHRPYIIGQVVTTAARTPDRSNGEDCMQVSRRDFVRLTASAGAGTAIGGLVGLGVTLAPATARAQELRIKDAKTTPSICPFCSVGCATLIHTVNGK